MTFTSTRLSQTLRRRRGATARSSSRSAPGPELEAEAQRLWQDGKPDEYFFLEVYGSAVVEHLVTMTGARLCAWADSRQHGRAAALQPGISRVGRSTSSRGLLDLINRARQQMPPRTLEVLESGMLRPKKSLLAVFGLTRHVDRVQRLTELVAVRELLVPDVPVPAQRRTPGAAVRQS